MVHFVESVAFACELTSLITSPASPYGACITLTFLPLNFFQLVAGIYIIFSQDFTHFCALGMSCSLVDTVYV